MRCFIAIPLSDNIHKELFKIQAQLKEVAADVRWVKIENVHLTLKFLGEVDESKIKTISEELKKNSQRTYKF
ncbi:MAG: RNA 2',3'-cyclic phosphodiesterase [Candidatus Omnitrophica bacterium]|nr:RNA 2',3'-cyclic phosphodiesterase [Candidatus Omnitrophota bacterium]